MDFRHTKRKLAVFLFRFCLYFSQKLRERYSWKSLFLLLLFITLLAGIKQYVLLFISPLLVNIAFPKINSKAILISSLSIIVLGFTSFDYGLELLHNKLIDFNQLAIETKANSYFAIKEYSTIKEFILSIPQFIYNVFIKPINPSSWNAFSIINALESFVLILLLIPLFWKNRRSFNKYLIGTLALYILLTVILIGSTVPITGALVRYRIVFIPFYLIFIFSFYTFNNIHSIFKKS